MDFLELPDEGAKDFCALLLGAGRHVARLGDEDVHVAALLLSSPVAAAESHQQLRVEARQVLFHLFLHLRDLLPGNLGLKILKVPVAKEFNSKRVFLCYLIIKI